MSDRWAAYTMGIIVGILIGLFFGVTVHRRADDRFLRQDKTLLDRCEFTLIKAREAVYELDAKLQYVQDHGMVCK